MRLFKIFRTFKITFEGKNSLERSLGHHHFIFQTPTPLLRAPQLFVTNVPVASQPQRVLPWNIAQKSQSLAIFHCKEESQGFPGGKDASGAQKSLRFSYLHQIIAIAIAEKSRLLVHSAPVVARKLLGVCCPTFRSEIFSNQYYQ